MWKASKKVKNQDSSPAVLSASPSSKSHGRGLGLVWDISSESGVLASVRKLSRQNGSQLQLPVPRTGYALTTSGELGWV